ncbi:hypothetical protein, partial [Dysgonomonas sp. Marseille-P4677]|uniref:hypothetical protein n=1 Tax=Dysgonomonas sp. Marseille-P4677 TaxID=2364790 RepID=UPI001F48CFFC
LLKDLEYNKVFSTFASAFPLKDTGQRAWIGGRETIAIFEGNEYNIIECSTIDLLLAGKT